MEHDNTYQLTLVSTNRVHGPSSRPVDLDALLLLLLLLILILLLLLLLLLTYLLTCILHIFTRRGNY